MKSKDEIVNEFLEQKWIKMFKESPKNGAHIIYSTDFEKGFDAALKYVWERAKEEQEDLYDGHCYSAKLHKATTMNKLQEICEVKDEK